MRTKALLLSVLVCSVAAAGSGCGLAALGSTALAGWIVVESTDDDDDPAPPPVQNSVPPAGSVWTESAGTTVGAGGTVTVRVMVSTASEVLGSYSMRMTYNSSAFTLQSVAGGSSQMGDPFLADTATTGTIFMSDMNAATPDAGANGIMEVAVLTFQANGSAGERLDLQGQLYNLADTTYPAENIGSAILPKNIKVRGDVFID